MKYILYATIFIFGSIFASEPPMEQTPKIGQQANAEMQKSSAENERAANQKLLKQKMFEGYLYSVGFELVNGKIQEKSQVN